MIWAKHSEIQQANLKTLLDSDVKDGERLSFSVKDMGSCEIYPQNISHNPNGRFVVVCGDGEYIIYTAMALRNKAFGSGQEFVWAADSSQYAVRENASTVKIFKNFKEKKAFKPDYGAEAIYGGFLLGIKSPSGLSFFDWDTLELVSGLYYHYPLNARKFLYQPFLLHTKVRRIEIQPRNVFWSENGELVAITTDDSYFVLSHDQSAAANAGPASEGGEERSEDGIEAAFDVRERETVRDASISRKYDRFFFLIVHHRSWERSRRT